MAVSGTSTGVLTFTASGDAVTDVHILESMRWIGATTAGHKCLVTDGSGNVVFFSEADGANFIDGWVLDRKWMNGVIAASMNSGQLQLYLSAR